VSEAVKLEESSYSKLLETMLEGMIVGQGDPPRIIFANRSLAEILGYSAEELTSLSSDGVINLIFPDDQKMFFGNYRARLEDKPAPARYEFRAVKKNKEVRWLEISSSRITFDGQPAVQATFTDITERKKAEEVLNLRLKEIKEFNKAAIGRELKMIALEQEVDDLLKELARPPKYKK
jgi:PAS domain S-box-containing protein